MGRAHKALESERWRRVRATVLERNALHNGGRCTIGSRACTGRADQVDHIVPLARGGARYELANLRAVCRACNLGRSALSVPPSLPRPRTVTQW